MKNIVYAIITLLVFVGCSKQQPASGKLLDEVEKIIEINPDSASTLLESISFPKMLLTINHLPAGACCQGK